MATKPSIVLALSILVMAACPGRARDEAEGPPPTDRWCEILERDPGSFMGRFTGTPAEFWRAIEDCGAPGGSDCARAYAGGRAVPSMAVSDGGGPPPGYEAAFVKACEGLPEPVRRCLVISHAIAHGEECEALHANARLNDAMR